MKPATQEQKQFFINLALWTMLTLVIATGLFSIWYDPKRLDYEGSHAAQRVAFALSTTIYDNQVRKLHEDTIREIAYQEGWNACVMRLVPELRPRRP